MTDHKTQYIALSLIYAGLIAIGLADARHWLSLAGAGLTVIGLGGGILTGKAMSSVTNKDGGTINVGPDAAEGK